MSLGLKARLERLEERWHKRSPQKSLCLFPDWLASEVRDQTWAADTGASIAAPGGDWQYQALPAQRKFHGDLNARFKGYSGPIGSGKSYALVYEALFLSRMNPGLLGLVGAPTYRMLHDSTQRTFFEVLDAEGIDYTFNKQQNHLRFLATGSEVIFRTMEAPESKPRLVCLG
jgi:hypothetical protein